MLLLGLEVSLWEKWRHLFVDTLGWGEEEDIWSWVGRVRGGWSEQLQVLRWVTNQNTQS